MSEMPYWEKALSDDGQRLGHTVALPVWDGVGSAVGGQSDWSGLAQRANGTPDGDPVNHPTHYTSVVPGIECIEVTQHFNFNLGNAIKYIWRSGSKGNQVEDLSKAAMYISFELERLEMAALDRAEEGL